MEMKMNPGESITLVPDWFVLTDGSAWKVPAKVGRIDSSNKVKVFIDHETPCGSEKVAAQQKALINFARDNALELSNGYGVSYQIMLDKHVKSGDVVLHCGDFGSMYGYAGALALKVTPEEMSKAIESGEFAWQVPSFAAVALTGSLKGPATGKDAALTLLKDDHGFGGKVLFVSGAEALPEADRLSFFQLLSASGCSAALCTAEKAADAFTLDLGTVVPRVSDAENLCYSVPADEASEIAVTSVFIGGCSAGRIEDIREAARVLQGRHVSRKVRLTVAFATTEVYIQAANEGLISSLMDGGAIVMNQGCSACYARSQGLADGEDTVLSAGSRVIPNCNGEGNVKTYLCSAATAMESAISGTVCPAKA